MEDEEYRPRAEDRLVEPLLAGLAPPPPAAEAPGGARRGCGRAALLALALAVGAWLLASSS